MRAALLLAGAALAVAPGCAAAPTRIVVVTDTDLRDADRVRFEVDDRAIGGGVTLREAELDAPGVELPIVMLVVSDGPSYGPITIRAVALEGDRELVSRAASLSFVPGRSIVLRLDLLDACREIACGERTTCLPNGSCGAIEIDGAGLPDHGGPSSIARGDASIEPAEDARVEPAPDAGGCAAGCECDRDCTERACACAAGCACELTCAAGAECGEIVCDGASCGVSAGGVSRSTVRCDHGAMCRLDARASSGDVVLECRGESDCEVDCTGAARCELRCEESSRCLLACAGAAECALDCDDGAEVECGGGLVACGRGCP